jgi:hypothetical protein
MLNINNRINQDIFQKIILKGKKLEGRFIAYKKTGFGVFGFPRYYKESKKYWYEGGAVIKNLITLECFFFGFKTSDNIKPDFDIDDKSFEKCFFSFREDKGYQDIIDDILEDLFSRCNSTEDPIPLINIDTKTQ